MTNWMRAAGVAAVLLAGIALGAVLSSDSQPWLDCPEDAVYAWQGGDFPDAVTWECIALDDLS